MGVYYFDAGDAGLDRVLDQLCGPDLFEFLASPMDYAGIGGAQAGIRNVTQKLGFSIGERGELN